MSHRFLLAALLLALTTLAGCIIVPAPPWGGGPWHHGHHHGHHRGHHHGHHW